MDALWSCTYFIASFNRLKWLIISFSRMSRVNFPIFEISSTISSLVFANNANFIFMEEKLLNLAPGVISSI